MWISPITQRSLPGGSSKVAFQWEIPALHGDVSNISGKIIGTYGKISNKPPTKTVFSVGIV